jgi:hypothetical protein
MCTDRSLLAPGMDEENAATTVEDPPDTPVLVTLGNADVPVCEDGSCAL